MHYYPDKWAIVKVTNSKGEVAHKILASWLGGFTSSDSWKLSSGNTHVAKMLENGFIEFPQYSGSTYVVNPEAYGLSQYTYLTYLGWVQAFTNNPESGSMELLDEDFDLASVLAK